jgi:hypothetical protein
VTEEGGGVGQDDETRKDEDIKRLKSKTGGIQNPRVH